LPPLQPPVPPPPPFTHRAPTPLTPPHAPGHFSTQLRMRRVLEAQPPPPRTPAMAFLDAAKATATPVLMRISGALSVASADPPWSGWSQQTLMLMTAWTTAPFLLLLAGVAAAALGRAIVWYRTRNIVPTATPATRSDRALATATARRLTATAVLQAAKMHRLLHLLLTALLVVAYCALVLRQADTPAVFATTAATSSAVLPEWRTARRPLVVQERHVEGWFGRLVEEVWSIRRCGDGVCDAPWEFAAFGPHGCRADCGVVPTAALRTVTVTLQVRLDRRS
jgi:hypothetical protein